MLYTRIYMCTINVHTVTKLVDKISLYAIFSGLDVHVNVQVVNEEGVGLCKEHYGAWYRHVHPFQTKCKTCYKNMTVLSKSRTCAQPDVVLKYLIQSFLVK